MSSFEEDLKKALEILSLPRFVSLKEIKIRYRQKSKEFHPDLNEDSSKMIELNEAYDFLKTYIENFRFTFEEDEVLKQFPEKNHARKFEF